MKFILLFLTILLSINDFSDREYSYLRDIEGNLTFADITEKTFQNTTKNNLGTTNGIYWLKIEDEIEERSILEVRNSHVEDLILYDSMGAIIPQLKNTRFPAFCLVNDAIIYPLYLRANFPLETLFAIENMSEAEFARKDKASLLNIGFFYGTALALMIATLLFFSIVKDANFLFLALTILAIAISVSGKDNILLLADILPNKIMMFESFGHLLVGLCATGYLLFNIKLRKHQIWIKNSMLVLSALSLVSWIIFIVSTSIYAFISVDITSVLTTILLFIISVQISKGRLRYILLIVYPVNTIVLINALVLHTLGITFIPVSVLHVCIAAALNFTLIAALLFMSFKSIRTIGIIREIEINNYIQQIKELDSYKNIIDADDTYLESLIYEFKLENIEVKVLGEISKGRSNSFIEEKYELSDKELQSITNSLNLKLGIEDTQEFKGLAIN